jgi:hypothetical protein
VCVCVQQTQAGGDVASSRVQGQAETERVAQEDTSQELKQASVIMVGTHTETYGRMATNLHTYKDIDKCSYAHAHTHTYTYTSTCSYKTLHREMHTHHTYPCNNNNKFPPSHLSPSGCRRGRSAPKPKFDIRAALKGMKSVAMPVRTHNG